MWQEKNWRWSCWLTRFVEYSNNCVGFVWRIACVCVCVCFSSVGHSIHDKIFWRCPLQWESLFAMCDAYDIPMDTQYLRSLMLKVHSILWWHNNWNHWHWQQLKVKIKIKMNAMQLCITWVRLWHLKWFSRCGKFNHWHLFGIKLKYRILLKYWYTWAH